MAARDPASNQLLDYKNQQKVSCQNNKIIMKRGPEALKVNNRDKIQILCIQFVHTYKHNAHTYRDVYYICRCSYCAVWAKVQIVVFFSLSALSVCPSLS